MCTCQEDKLTSTDSLDEELYEAGTANDILGVQDALSRGANATHVIHDAASMWSAALIRLLVNSGADIHMPDVVTHMTPLHYAAASGLTNNVILLLANGANCDAKDGMDETPLQKASRYGHRRAAEALRRYGQLHTPRCESIAHTSMTRPAPKPRSR
jgi:ankyrin repeat protein